MTGGPVLFAHTDQRHRGGGELMLLRLARRTVPLRPVTLALMHDGAGAALSEDACFSAVHRLDFPRALEVAAAARTASALVRLRGLMGATPACCSFSWPAALRVGLAALSLRRRPRLAWLCQEELWPLTAKRRAGLALVAASGTMVVCPSASVRGQLIAAGFPPRRVQVMRIAVDTAYFSPDDDSPASRAALRQRLGLAPETFVVVCVARLDPNKRQRTLIEAVALATRHGVTLELVCVGEEWGDGQQRKLEATARRLGVGAQVRFVGHQSDVRPWLAAADVVALASQREAAGMVLDEAAAMARPVVASRVGGTPELVMHGHTGFLFAPDDPAGCARHLLRLASEPELARQMGARARARCLATASEDIVGASWDELVSGLVRGVA